MGGEITYRHLGGYTYELILTTYTRDQSLADRCELEVFWGDCHRDTLTRVNGDYNTVCGLFAGEGQVIGNNTRINIYLGYHTYSKEGIYTISMQDPNRAVEVVNMVNSFNVPFYIDATITVFDPLLYCVNNSVAFYAPPIFQVNDGSIFNHNLTAFDIDGDSLSYKLVPCRGYEGNVVEGYAFPNSMVISATSGTTAFPNCLYA